jgi:hypothetical protein
MPGKTPRPAGSSGEGGDRGRGKGEVNFITGTGWLLIAVGLWAGWRVARGNSGDMIWLALLAIGGGILLIFGRTWFLV